MLIRIRYSSKRQQNSYFESFIRRNRKKWRFIVFLYLLNRPNFPKEENFLAVKISFWYDKRQSSTVFIWQCIYSWLLNQILFSLGLASNWDRLEIFRKLLGLFNGSPIQYLKKFKDLLFSLSKTPKVAVKLIRIRYSSKNISTAIFGVL